jgi:hypothetical protein
MAYFRKPNPTKGCKANGRRIRRMIKRKPLLVKTENLLSITAQLLANKI